MPSQVFLSYSHVDSAVADELANALDNAGVTYFRDVKDVDWGDSITSRIHDAVRASDAIIVILSPASLKSAWVPFELGGAIALGKKLLPYLTHPALDLPAYLQDIKAAQTIPEVVQFLSYLDTEPVHAHVDDAHQAATVQVSPEGRTMILEMSKDDHGLLLHTRTSSGTSFQSRGQNLCPDQSPRTVATWKAALEDLVAQGVIEPRGHKGDVFALTAVGFEIADTLESE